MTSSTSRKAVRIQAVCLNMESECVTRLWRRLTVIPKKGGEARVISAQDVEKIFMEKLLAYCKRLRMNAGEVVRPNVTVAM